VEWFYQKKSSQEEINQQIWRLLEFQKLEPTVEFVHDIVQACSIYYDRMTIEDNKGANPRLEIEKYLSKLKKLNHCVLSYEASLEIGHLVEKLREVEKELEELSCKIAVGKGRPETWARDVFISDLAIIYYKHTGKKPGLPYLSSSKTENRQRRGPFFRFVKAFLGVVTNSPRLSDAAINTSIRKIIEAEHKIFKLRKRHWPHFKATHPWERLT
jgi:hypothetical protein